MSEVPWSQGSSTVAAKLLGVIIFNFLLWKLTHIFVESVSDKSNESVLLFKQVSISIINLYTSWIFGESDSYKVMHLTISFNKFIHLSTFSQKPLLSNKSFLIGAENVGSRTAKICKLNLVELKLSRQYKKTSPSCWRW